MSEIQCFKSIRGTAYDKAVKKHFNQLPRWKNVIRKVGELLDEDLEALYSDVHRLSVSLDALTREDNFKLFTKDGLIKQNSKQAKEINQKYLEILKQEGLDDFRELGRINFSFGIMRVQGQTLRSFRTSDYDIYFETDFDLSKRAKGIVEPISQIEYQEKYLGELKKAEATEGGEN